MKLQAITMLLAALLPLAAQNFNSGSNTTDGDLTFPNAKPGDTIIFDPRNTTLFPGGLDKDMDNVSLLSKTAFWLKVSKGKQAPLYLFRQ